MYVQDRSNSSGVTAVLCQTFDMILTSSVFLTERTLTLEYTNGSITEK